MPGFGELVVSVPPAVRNVPVACVRLLNSAGKSLAGRRFQQGMELAKGVPHGRPNLALVGDGHQVIVRDVALPVELKYNPARKRKIMCV